MWLTYPEEHERTMRCNVMVCPSKIHLRLLEVPLPKGRSSEEISGPLVVPVERRSSLDVEENLSIDMTKKRFGIRKMKNAHTGKDFRTGQGARRSTRRYQR